MQYIDLTDIVTNTDNAVTLGTAGTNFKINIADSWKTVDTIKINIGDAWKTVDSAQINIGDSWKTIF